MQIPTKRNNTKPTVLVQIHNKMRTHPDPTLPSFESFVLRVATVRT